MSRLLVWVFALSLFGSVAASRASAQSTGGDDLRTITSQQGYQFQVPADWRTVPSGATARALDIEVVSPDGSEAALVAVSTVPAALAGDPSRLAQQAAAGFSEGLQQAGGTAASFVDGPNPVQIVNADTAVAWTASSTDVEGNSGVTGVRLALQGTTEFLFAVVGTEDFYSSDPTFGAILDSFQLIGAPRFALSPEEAVIALLPYKLSPQDAPAGYSVGPVSEVITPATFAAQLPFSADAFRAYENAGQVVGFRQPLTPNRPSATTMARGFLTVDLFTNVESARRFATGDALLPVNNASYRYDPVDLNNSLGDASAAWHVTWTPPDQPAQGSYDIHWQRGQVTFTIQTDPQALGQEQQTGAESLASALDTLEQSRPPLDLGPARVTPPATEAQRLRAALQLKSFFAPASAAPDGFLLTGSNIAGPADSVVAAPDPTAALRNTDERWKWVVSARQLFTNQQNSSARIVTQATLCADPQSARADAADLSNATPGWTVSPLEPQLRLGDATFAFHASGTSGDGSPYEGTYLYWTHGALILSVRVLGPEGTTSMDQAGDIAQQVERRFQDFPLPTTGIGGVSEIEPAARLEPDGEYNPLDAVTSGH
jgi:hypothetical protein